MEENRIGLVLMLLREGDTSLAVSVYQEEAGVGVLAARRAVNELARQHGIRTRRRSVWALALVAFAAVVGLVLSH